ncbi:MAG: hypothetical protein HOV82_03225 [Streptomyces sp.]|nr:hypothetical protein [Streptomyces sp.]
MGKRYIRKMLGRMSGGEPVEATSAMGTIRALSRLAFYAEQFGYAYAEVRQRERKYLIRIVPDPSPQARARAAENWARYPGAADGGALPPLDPGAVALFKARIGYDLATRFTEKQMAAITAVGFTLLSLGPALRFGPVVGVVVWAVLMALVPVLYVVNRRYRARRAALLEAAGFRPVTEPDGRLRYVPPPPPLG